MSIFSRGWMDGWMDAAHELTIAFICRGLFSIGKELKDGTGKELVLRTKVLVVTRMRSFEI